ncbi:MAG: hypothetical protein ABWZ54_09150 [Luteibacter sp.]
MSMRGATLVELLVGLAVAGMVVAVTSTALGVAGTAARRHARAVSGEDAAWEALAAMVDDLRHSSVWRACTEARDCSVTRRADTTYRTYVLHTDRADWLLADTLRRCTDRCDEFMQGVRSFDVLADIADAAGVVSRVPLFQGHGDAARAVEVALTLEDGRRFSRVVGRRRGPSMPGP